jgi:tripeptidyl-peptidase-1
MTIRMLRLCTPSFSSVSSGDPETEVHASTRRRVDVEFMKAGLRGLTLAFSSGDSGPWDEDFQPDGGLFTANYPTSCPYVTAVGGTEFDRCGEVGHEVGVQCTSSCYDDPKTNDTRGYSGGGFSTFYAPPLYQADVRRAWMAAAKDEGMLPRCGATSIILEQLWPWL